MKSRDYLLVNKKNFPVSRLFMSRDYENLKIILFFVTINKTTFDRDLRVVCNGKKLHSQMLATPNLSFVN